MSEMRGNKKERTADGGRRPEPKCTAHAGVRTMDPSLVL